MEAVLFTPVCLLKLFLSLELSSHQWDAADDIHRSLMVDHVTEVSQWMVGVKRLIAEKRSLSSEEETKEEKSAATTKEDQAIPGFQQAP
jgi:hypothetical protein